MTRIIISDTGPLIVLGYTNNLHLLTELFSEVWITGIVFEELCLEQNKPGNRNINYAISKGWINIHKQKIDIPHRLNEILEPGECSSIALAKNKIGLLLIDDKKGRMYAKKYGADIIGTGAVLLFAKKKGLNDSVSAILLGMKQSGYHLSDRLCDEIIRLADE